MELIIYDAEIQNLADFCNKTGGELEVLFYKYILILNSIRKHALKSGDAAKNMDAFISYASKMLGDLGQISLDTKLCIRNYLTEIDSTDKYLF